VKRWISKGSLTAQDKQGTQEPSQKNKQTVLDHPKTHTIKNQECVNTDSAILCVVDYMYLIQGQY